jgi:ribose/xylose/arabinose/galactoside ABC-type transport system permease subunit
VQRTAGTSTHGTLYEFDTIAAVVVVVVGTLLIGSHGIIIVVAVLLQQRFAARGRTD